jgi:hypothetical protein
VILGELMYVSRLGFEIFIVEYSILISEICFSRSIFEREMRANLEGLANLRLILTESK